MWLEHENLVTFSNLIDMHRHQYPMNLHISKALMIFTWAYAMQNVGRGLCIALPHEKGQSAARTLLFSAFEKENDLRPKSGIIAEFNSVKPHPVAKSQNIMPEP